MLIFKLFGRFWLSLVAACAIGLSPAAAAELVTYSWTTTNAGFGSHVSQPTSATFQVPLSSVLAGKINYSDISNIQFAYPGLTFNAYSASVTGLDFASYVDPATGAFIFNNVNQGLAVIGYEGGLFSDSFLSITVGNPNPSFTGVADQFNALKMGSPYAGFPTAGYWTANFPTTSAVPEPATWAMMLLGFGAVGFAMRRKRHFTTSYATA